MQNFVIYRNVPRITTYMYRVCITQHLISHCHCHFGFPQLPNKWPTTIYGHVTSHWSCVPQDSVRGEVYCSCMVQKIRICFKALDTSDHRLQSWHEVWQVVVHKLLSFHYNMHTWPLSTLSSVGFGRMEVIKWNNLGFF